MSGSDLFAPSPGYAPIVIARFSPTGQELRPVVSINSAASIPL